MHDTPALAASPQLDPGLASTGVAKSRADTTTSALVMPHAVLVPCLLHQTGRRRRAFIGGLEKEDIEEDEKGEDAAAALYLFISHAETLLSLPVKPA